MSAVIAIAPDGSPRAASAMPAASATTGADRPLAGKTIVIDPGHNGGNAAHPREINKQVPAGGFNKACDTAGTATDDGALSETAFNWDLAKRLRRLLLRTGASVVLTRHNDRGVGPCINIRAAIGNRANADLAISLHADGGPPNGHGFHVIRPGLVRGYTEPIVGRSRTLAADVRDGLVRAGLVTSTYAGRKGVDRRTDLGGLNLSKIPKVLLETGNMRNVGDAARLERKRWREHTAAALRDALATYLAR
ncbi:MAG: N-acetylmuramoyl-L-alanine amidase [Thermoleophilia bacterium]|nr:N-acetylmuramoyl-L-alanine amidase [Thermoleophilia bacterium]